MALWVPLFSSCSYAANKTDSQFLLYNKYQLDMMKLQLHNSPSEELQRDVKILVKAADTYLRLAPSSVVQKTTPPPSGDAHDYVSLARYYWPDPTKSDGRHYISRDGETNPERESTDKYDAVRMEKMVNAVSTLSLAYYLTGNEIYAAHAVRHLQVWFIQPDTRMNPNLNFGQGVPGKSDGRPSGIIETGQLIAILDATRMLDASPAWSTTDEKIIKEWFSAYLDWLLTSKLGIAESKAKNNHGVWYDVQVAAFAYYTGKSDLAARIVQESGLRRIQTQIEPDGSMPLELARTRSMQYTMFNLAAFITLARVGEDVGVNLWDYQTMDARDIKTAINYLIPYIEGTKSWEYQTIQKESPDWFARYLAIAANRYQSPSYAQSAWSTLGSKSGLNRIAIASFLENRYGQSKE
jgi:hypothetical protein